MRRRPQTIRALRWAAGAALAAFLVPQAHALEPLTLGLNKGAGSGPAYIAIERGYFAAEGFDVKLAYFDAAEPIAVAVAAGAVDLGNSALTAGLYNLGSQLRIVGGLTREVPGFHLFAFVESNRAYDAGLKSYRDLAGHSFGVNQIGSGLHYLLDVIATKYGVDFTTMRVVALQGNANMISAVTGGQIDVIGITGSQATPSLQRGDARLMGWVGDEVGYQSTTVLVTRKMADEQRDKLIRFMRAEQKGVDDYHAAFATADEKRGDQATAPAILTILSHYIGQPPEQVDAGISYVDPKMRVDVKDVHRQIAWFKAHRMVKPEIDADAIVDLRYIKPVPGE
jgi:NitT/TauT family transport system substrate-binding protein